MMPLSMVNVGEQGKIVKVTGKDEIRQHLASLGFIEGEVITVVSKISGNMIISVKEARIALSNELACRIMV